MVLKIVRTVAGARRYQQPKGSIIVRDGANPLDALVGLANDREGYEKVADLDGNPYYVGHVDDKWVVESGIDGSRLKEFESNTEAFEWLNREVGGAKPPADPKEPPIQEQPGVSPQRARDRVELERRFSLTEEQSSALSVLKDSELSEYRRLRERGLSHTQAYRESRAPGRSGNPHLKNGKKDMDTDLEYKRQFSADQLEELGKAGKAFKNHNGEWSYPVANEQDLKNAIQAVGRCAPEDRNALIRYLKRRASALGKTDLIPEQWSDQKGYMSWTIEEKVHGHRPLERAPGRNDNWVEATDKLPAYIEHIAQALHERRGFTISHAIATAVNRVKRWAAGLDNVSAKTRAKAIKAVAEWEALKLKNRARKKK